MFEEVMNIGYITLNEATENFMAGMKALNELPEYFIISKVLTSDPNAVSFDKFRTYPRDKIIIGLNGIEGTRHFRDATYMGGRRPEMGPRASVVKDNRKLFAASPLEYSKISENLGYELNAELLGINLEFKSPDGTDIKLHDLGFLGSKLHFQIFPENFDGNLEKNDSLVALLEVVGSQMGCKQKQGRLMGSVYGGNPTEVNKIAEKFQNVGARGRGLILDIRAIGGNTMTPDGSERVELRPGMKVYPRLHAQLFP